MGSTVVQELLLKPDLELENLLEEDDLMLEVRSNNQALFKL